MKDTSKMKLEGRRRRHSRVRAKVSGTADRPRLAVFRSAKHIQAQIIDDMAGRTLASADDLKLDRKALGKEAKDKGAKTAAAYSVGKTIAERAKKAKINKVVFDRGGFAYAGRVAALAQGARDGGLEF